MSAAGPRQNFQKIHSLLFPCITFGAIMLALELLRVKAVTDPQIR
jgi:hypothetical protein